MRIEELFKKLNDDEIRQAVKEIKETEQSKIKKENGFISKLCYEIYDITGEPPSFHTYLVQNSILKEAAYRFS